MIRGCKTCTNNCRNAGCINCGAGYPNYVAKGVPTNADYVRSMPDEVLAEFMDEFAYTVSKQYTPNSKADWLKWLRKEKGA